MTTSTTVRLPVVYIAHLLGKNEWRRGPKKEIVNEIFTGISVKNRNIIS